MDFTRMPAWLLAGLGLTRKRTPAAPEQGPDLPDPSKPQKPERGTLAWLKAKLTRAIAGGRSTWRTAQRQLVETFRLRGRISDQRGTFRRRYPIPLPPNLMGAPARLRRKASRWLAREIKKRQARRDTSGIRLPRWARWPR